SATASIGAIESGLSDLELSPGAAGSGCAGTTALEARRLSSPVMLPTQAAYSEGSCGSLRFPNEAPSPENFAIRVLKPCRTVNTLPLKVILPSAGDPPMT